MQRVVVLGGGESGAGAAVLAKVKGFDVFLSDNGMIKEEMKELLRKYDIPFEEGGHTAELILNANEVIKSPGIPENVPLIVYSKNNKPVNLGLRETFADIACTIADNFNVEKPTIGKSFIEKI